MGGMSGDSVDGITGTAVIVVRANRITKDHGVA
jgi:hypothetical protein